MPNNKILTTDNFSPFISSSISSDTENNVSDKRLPTSQAVKDYVDSNISSSSNGNLWKFLGTKTIDSSNKVYTLETTKPANMLFVFEKTGYPEDKLSVMFTGEETDTIKPYQTGRLFYKNDELMEDVVCPVKIAYSYNDNSTKNTYIIFIGMSSMSNGTNSNIYSGTITMYTYYMSPIAPEFKNETYDYGQNTSFKNNNTSRNFGNNEQDNILFLGTSLNSYSLRGHEIELF